MKAMKIGFYFTENKEHSLKIFQCSPVYLMKLHPLIYNTSIIYPLIEHDRNVNHIK